MGKIRRRGEKERKKERKDSNLIRFVTVISFSSLTSPELFWGITQDPDDFGFVSDIETDGEEIHTAVPQHDTAIVAGTPSHIRSVCSVQVKWQIGLQFRSD